MVDGEDRVALQLDVKRMVGRRHTNQTTSSDAPITQYHCQTRAALGIATSGQRILQRDGDSGRHVAIALRDEPPAAVATQ